MTTRCGNAFASGDNSRTHNGSRVHCIPQRDVYTGTTAVAHGGKTGHEIFLRINGALKSDIGFVECKSFHELILARLTFEVDMQVDQSGHNGFVTEIDNLIVVGCRREAFLDANDLVAFDNNGDL